MRMVGYALLYAALLALVCVWNAGAHAKPRTHTYSAIVRCAHIAEDSAAHVRLVDYAHDGATLIYRCERNGY